MKDFGIPRGVGDEDPCGDDDYCDDNDDVRRSKRDHPQERPQALDMRGECEGNENERNGTYGELGEPEYEWFLLNFLPSFSIATL